MFIGFVELADALKASIVVRNASLEPVHADSTPTFRVYGDDGLMNNGTGSLSVKDSGVVTNATNASPIVITTSAAHKLQSGMRVKIASVGGNTAANGTFTITVASSTTFSLGGSTGNGSYTSGGTYAVAGLYEISFTPAAGNGFEAGKFYTVMVNYEVSSAVQSQTFTFGVV